LDQDAGTFSKRARERLDCILVFQKQRIGRRKCQPLHEPIELLATDHRHIAGCDKDKFALRRFQHGQHAAHRTLIRDRIDQLAIKRVCSGRTLATGCCHQHKGTLPLPSISQPFQYRFSVHHQV
jgi:hypothetical protein